MQGIQAGRDLHALHAVNRLAVGEDDTCLLQRRTPVGEGVLHHQILRALRVDEGRQIGPARRDDGRHLLDAVRRQPGLHGRRGPWGDLVDHAPGEGHFFLILKPGDEIFRNKTLFCPRFRHGQDRGFELLTVMGAVVHAHHRDREAARLPALQQQGGGDRHGMPRVCGSVGHVLFRQPVQGIALLRDGVGDHLQRRRAENRFQPLPVRLFAGLGHPRFRHRRDDLPARGAVREKRHGHGQAVKAAVDRADVVHVKGVRRDDPGVGPAGVQEPLLQGRDKGPENIPRPEMHPGGLFRCFPPHRGYIILRERHMGLFPERGFGEGGEPYFHGCAPPFGWFRLIIPQEPEKAKLFAGEPKKDAEAFSSASRIGSFQYSITVTMCPRLSYMASWFTISILVE